MSVRGRGFCRTSAHGYLGWLTRGNLVILNPKPATNRSRAASPAIVPARSQRRDQADKLPAIGGRLASAFYGPLLSAFYGPLSSFQLPS